MADPKAGSFLHADPDATADGLKGQVGEQPGQDAPSRALQAGGVDGNGKLRAIKTDADGHPEVKVKGSFAEPVAAHTGLTVGDGTFVEVVEQTDDLGDRITEFRGGVRTDSSHDFKVVYFDAFATFSFGTGFSDSQEILVVSNNNRGHFEVERHGQRAIFRIENNDNEPHDYDYEINGVVS